MCLILLAYKKHPSYKLIIAANRDEFYERPTAPSAFWEEASHVLGGRDLVAGGAWLGITRQGRFAAVTNYRDPASIKETAPSRGRLVSRFLLGRETPLQYIENLSGEADTYNGFNLIAGDRDSLFWYSNRGDGPQEMPPGVHGLSNRLLNTPWPKVAQGRARLDRLISGRQQPPIDKLFQMLRDREAAADESLPDTGVGLEWERTLSPIFISSPDYGTRSSTLIFWDRRDRVTFIERAFDPESEKASTRKYEFQVE